MYIYIDALFRLRITGFRDAPSWTASNLTSDDPDVRKLPPFMLVPSRIMTATQDGDVDTFNCDDIGLDKMMVEFNDKITDRESRVNVTYVGWNLDSVIVPCLGANSMILNKRIPSRFLRMLNDKWSKPAGCSVERAFIQGWYPPAKDSDAVHNLTLDEALLLNGMKSLDAIRHELGDDIAHDKSVLLSRLSAISSLYSRYDNLINYGLQ